MTTAIICAAILAALVVGFAFDLSRKPGGTASRGGPATPRPTLMVLCCWWGPAQIWWRPR